jgi:cytochrome c-type biogenesis protein
MMEQIFLTINEWLAGGTAIAFAGSFLWGMVSVLFSPCHLASIPLIVAYVGGQERVLLTRQAGYYSVAFTSGLFTTIALIGVISVLLGRMLGDIGNYWQILVGVILIWVALGMLGVEKCSMSGSLLYRLHLKGLFGALVLGLAYGVLSGSCTFGFIAPILAIISVQKEVSTGLVLILLFAVGHCLPIVVAGSSTAAVRKVVENHSWQTGGQWFRRGAGVLIGILGIYFMINPFVFS